MNNKTKNHFLIKGDIVIMGIIFIISIISIIIVYSASSNLQYTINNSTVLNHTGKHIFIIMVGLVLIYFIARIPKYEYIGVSSIILLVLFFGLLLYNFFSGGEIAGASAARWINIGGFSFQPSIFTYLILVIYMCRYLAQNLHKNRTFITHALCLFLPILVIVLLIGKENGSTAGIIFLTSIIIMFIGKLSWKYIVGFISFVVVLGLILYISFLKYPNFMGSNRVHAWENRIRNFFNNTSDKETYQINRAKAAIVNGGITGVGPGNSYLKYTLPQSSSDFIFAIIIEEYGIFGGIVLLGLYAVILIRIIIILNNLSDFFSTLLTLSIGIMIFIQITIHIAVVLDILPTTGQPLPFISYGGTSLIVNYLQIGLVLNMKYINQNKLNKT